MDERSSNRIGETDTSRAIFHGYDLWSTRLDTKDSMRIWRGGGSDPNGNEIKDERARLFGSVKPRQKRMPRSSPASTPVSESQSQITGSQTGGQRHMVDDSKKQTRQRNCSANRGKGKP